MIEYSDQEFEKKLMLLTNTQSAINSLSTWCLNRHKNYKSIIAIWWKAIRKVKIEKRLTWFYLANHIIQYSKKKNYKFVDEWVTVIQKAIPYVRDEKIQSQISRIIKIWEERGVYDKNYLANLTYLLTSPIPNLKLADPVQKFQVHALVAKMQSCVKLEKITDLNMKHLREATLTLSNIEAIQNMMKDRISNENYLKKLNKVTSNIESNIICFKQKTIDRAHLINALEVDISYYDKQTEEVKIIAQACTNYTKRVIHFKSELESMIGSLPTNRQMPSADINAISPSTSSVSIKDLNIHNISYDTVSNFDKYMTNSSIDNSIIDTNISVPTSVINNIKSHLISATVQAIENHDQQSLISQVIYDATLPPPDATFPYLEFSPNQTNVSYSNNMNNHSESTTYSTSNDAACIPTLMSYSQQYNITSEFSNNMAHPTNSSSLTNENTVAWVQSKDWDVSLHNDWSTVDTSALSTFHDNISNEDTPIIIKTDAEQITKHCDSATKIIDKNERVSQNTIIETPHIDHSNLISLTNVPDINASMISVNFDYPLSCIPLPQSESINMDISDDDEKPKSNHDQNHPVPIPPPNIPLLPFDFYQPTVPDVTNQWEKPSQQWGNERPNFNEHQWYVEQSKQWIQMKSDSYFVHNQHQLQWTQHIQRTQFEGDFKPKWNRGRSSSLGSPRNVSPHSRPTDRSNQGPWFDPKNQPL